MDEYIGLDVSLKRQRSRCDVEVNGFGAANAHQIRSFSPG